MESFLGSGALFERHGAVVDEHVDALSAHAVGDGLGQRAALAEEQTLLPGSTAGRIRRERRNALVLADLQLPLRWELGRVHDLASTLRGAREPGEDRRWIPNSGAQTDALHIVG